jgi:UDP-GlcNAc:undecaprenyl-phosphate/decaprenyl-phosphate GlcNAc-1-phosphate transferase
MYFLKILSFLLAGMSVSWGLIVLILRWAERRHDLIRDNEFHHAHKAAIPRLGGIALSAATIACAGGIAVFSDISTNDAATLFVIVSSSLAMFALGLWDDLRPLGAKFKLAGQIAIASAVYFSNIRIDLVKSPASDGDISLGAVGFLATVFWLVSLTNLINLIDGIDGLAGGICLMLMFLLANLGMGGDSGFTVFLAIGVTGALLAFLKFNYPPAKIYMGDGGAYFLGFLIGILSIVNSNKGTVAAALIAPAFALALPIVDVGLAMLRRGLRGLPLFRPDRKHIHHHLITLGISREGTLLNLYTVSLMCLFLAFGIFYLQGRMLPLYTGLLFLVLLIAGHLSGFTKNWFEISSQLGKSLALRKETRYALTLNRWLVLEIERHDSTDQFWRDYQFVIKKLRFTQVTVHLPDGSKNTWRSREIDDDSAADFHHALHEISNGTVIELYAPKTAMSDNLFNLLGDLAAETWYKTTTRWKALHKPPLHFRASPISLANATKTELAPLFAS